MNCSPPPTHPANPQSTPSVLISCLLLSHAARWRFRLMGVCHLFENQSEVNHTENVIRVISCQGRSKTTIFPQEIALLASSICLTLGRVQLDGVLA